MKKIVTSLLIFALVLVGCSNKENSDAIQIGIIQPIQHGALDASREGFIKALADEGYVDGENIVIDYQNSNDNADTLSSISQKFVNDKKDLILSIATNASVSIANETKDIPILVTAVTDLIDAGLVDDYEVPGGNLSGTTDMTPVVKQLELLLKLKPNIKVVGLLYTQESNSIIQIDIAKKYLDSIGMKYEEGVPTSTNDIAQVTETLANKVDAIYVPTDNTIASAVATVVQITDPLGIPTVGGATAMVEDGMTATVGLDYYKLGYQTGKMAVRILKGEDISKMSIEGLEDVDLVFNQRSIDDLQIDIPTELLESALEIYK